MAEYVIMPKADYEAACSSIRAKTGKTDLIKSGSLSTEIDSITGGGSAEGLATVTFMNGDVELFSRPVYIGDDCPDPIAQGRFDTPTKESTAQYNYVFYGWGASDGGAADGNILKNITEDKTVYAVFTAVVRYYTITYLDSDGVTVLKTESLAYGAMPAYIAEKDGYKLTGWEPSFTSVTGEASYCAQWQEMLNLEGTSWATIAELAESGEAANRITLGDTKTLTLTLADGKTHEVVLEVAGFNHDTKADGSGNAGITFITKKVYVCDTYGTGEKLTMGGNQWSSSTIRTWCNGTLLNAFPEALRSVVKPVTKKTHIKKYNAETTTDSVWIPSCLEMTTKTLSNSYSSENPTTYPLYTDDASRIRYGARNNATTAVDANIPLRSHITTDTSNPTGKFVVMGKSGGISGSSVTSSSYGQSYIMFGFCI